MVPCTPPDDRVRDTSGAVVNVHDQLAHDGAVGEGHESRIPLESRVQDELTSQAGMHCADVTHRVPDMLWRRVNQQFPVNGSHGPLRMRQLDSNQRPAGMELKSVLKDRRAL